MKRCPTCNKTYTDQNLSFCVEDGTPLANVPEPESGPASATGSGAPSDWKGAPYQPPGSYLPAGGSQKRRTWPWVLGISIVVVVGVLCIAGAILLATRVMQPTSVNHNASQGNANERSEPNSTLPNSEGGNSANTNSRNDVPAPTDQDAVLAQLTAIEHEWTAANLNADKKKLGIILADDYVGTSGDGKTQGKAEYIKTIVRDTSVQKWDFENLKLTLRGERATLTGIVRLVVQDKNIAYKFTDKFVWRDGRWQATGSEVALEQ